MAHFAKIGLNNKVIGVEYVNNNVLLDADGAESEFNGIDFLTKLTGWPIWKKTSFNTLKGIHYSDDAREIPSEDQSKSFRKNFAGIGYEWDEDRNAFTPPKPKNDGSWILDENTCDWVRPVAKPELTGDGTDWQWNEDNYQADNSTGWIPYTLTNFVNNQ
jgi:hypothetical protein